MKWHVLLGRRRMDDDAARAWLEADGLRTYAQLCDWCAANGVEPPGREEVGHLLRPKAKPARARPVPKPRKKRPTKPGGASAAMSTAAVVAPAGRSTGDDD